MGRKRDTREVEAIARDAGMNPVQRRQFGDYLEECKRTGERGTRNDRGDFTWEEMIQKAREFLREGQEY